MWFYRRAFNRSKKIFTVSQFSKSRIEHYSSKKIPVIVTHSALQPYLIRKDNAASEKKDCILFIGNIKKHKGLSCLLEAFFLARGKGLPHTLIIVGNKDNFRSADTELAGALDSALKRGIAFTGQISDEQLKTLLCQAALLVQPSLYEGFGLPPLEAMTCGTQALISDIPVFKEIYGGFPVTFFNAGDSEDLSRKLLELLRDKPPLRITLDENLANKYTFQKTASIILRNITVETN
jgi:glycosyltransferase involved in cell wall biosynthesis